MSALPLQHFVPAFAYGLIGILLLREKKMEKQMLSYNFNRCLPNNNMPWFIFATDISQYYTQSEAITRHISGLDSTDQVKGYSLI